MGIYLDNSLRAKDGKLFKGDTEVNFYGSVSNPTNKTINWNPNEYELTLINFEEGTIELKRKDA